MFLYYSPNSTALEGKASCPSLVFCDENRNDLSSVCLFGWKGHKPFLDASHRDLKETSEPPPIAEQAGCFQGQKRLAVTRPSSSHVQVAWIGYCKISTIPTLRHWHELTGFQGLYEIYAHVLVHDDPWSPEREEFSTFLVSIIRTLCQGNKTLSQRDRLPFWDPKAREARLPILNPLLRDGQNAYGLHANANLFFELMLLKKFPEFLFRPVRLFSQGVRA
ncbi:hypothetical protein J6590_031831 [Homalodisca vitripennis]|nr:hypothetical protein J6590_031831 [Homalodisca vitripennis]